MILPKRRDVNQGRSLIFLIDDVLRAAVRAEGGREIRIDLEDGAAALTCQGDDSGLSGHGSYIRHLLHVHTFFDIALVHEKCFSLIIRDLSGHLSHRHDILPEVLEHHLILRLEVQEVVAGVQQR